MEDGSKMCLALRRVLVIIRNTGAILSAVKRGTRTIYVVRAVREALMNQYEALVEIVKATPPAQRGRIGTLYAVKLVLPGLAGLLVTIAALLH